MTRSERASKIRVAPELSARTLTATQSSRTIAFTRATKFRETFGLGFTLCSLARVSRRDRRHLGLPPYTAVYSTEPLVASAAETLGDEYDQEEQTERWLTSRRGSETRWQPSATLEYDQASIWEATDCTDAHRGAFRSPGRATWDTAIPRPPTISTLSERIEQKLQLPRMTSQESRWAVNGPRGTSVITNRSYESHTPRGVGLLDSHNRRRARALWLLRP